MIRWIRVAFLAALLLQAGEAMAQDLKIAVVNLQRLTTATEEGKKATERLEKRYQEIVAEMDKLSKGIQAKEEQLQRQGLTLSATRRDQLTREIEADKRNLTRKNEDYQMEMSQMEQDLMGPVMQAAEAVFAAYVKDKGYSLVINLSAEGGNLVWYNAGNDITDEVIKVINQVKLTPASPAAAPDAATEKPPATPPAATPAK